VRYQAALQPVAPRGAAPNLPADIARAVTGGTYAVAMSSLTPPKAASVGERAASGKAVRARHPRRSLGNYEPGPQRPDPRTTLSAQEAVRVPELLPVRHERMSANPFAFYRGAAAVMAQDLGALPNTGILVQLCGDAHLMNLGLFAGPDRKLVFDVNDFDETNPGPFEWDVMRLATSFVVAGQAAGLRSSVVRSLPGIVAQSYQASMASYSTMNDLDVWYSRIDTDVLLTWARKAKSRFAERALQVTEQAAAAKDRWSAVRSLTSVGDGTRRFKDRPPLLTRIPDGDERRELIGNMYGDYRASLLVDRANLLSRYHWIDAGHKVVGVGSVGLLAYVLLLQGRDANDLLVLQVKQAVASVLEPFTSPSKYSSHGERVVAGQRLMQASTDAFLGYVVGQHGHHYYVRQLRDMKWGPDPLKMTAQDFRTYAELCGLALARAHARSGDSVAITGYLGSAKTFAHAITAFAEAYAEQNTRDFELFVTPVQPN
jgi:uncharacterized protein (DUF2252 family)